VAQVALGQEQVRVDFYQATAAQVDWEVLAEPGATVVYSLAMAATAVSVALVVQAEQHPGLVFLVMEAQAVTVEQEAARRAAPLV
jgi:hypothetical protein